MKRVRMLLTGEMGSGKGVASDYYAREYGAVTWSRTELMKRLAHAVADHLGDIDEILAKLFSDSEERRDILAELIAYAKSYVPEPGKPRRLYQDITQICQDYDPYCFERELAERIDGAGDHDFTLVDDVRSPEAFRFFADRGYVTVRIYADENVRRERMLERDGYLPDEETFHHPSETALRDVPHDYVIDHSVDDYDAYYRDLDALIAKVRGE